MSTNRPSTTKPDSRIAQKEAIVTRHKSAQMKRQLRKKDRSMKRFTDLLKSPTKEPHPTTKTVPVKKKQTSPKAKQSLLKSAEKVQNLPQKTFKLSKVIRKEVILIPDEEYYPNKLKRKLMIRKVVLKPKNALKVVGEMAGSIKRKCAIPVKATEKLSPGSQEANPVQTRLSMAEAMSIMEDQLTDEDLMEILTCPSPVWWEDPPDEEYIEDAIFTRPKVQPPAPAEPIEVDGEMENDANRFIAIPNLSSKSDKFLKKRSKLEDLLGNIKDKSKTDKRNSTKDIFNEDVVVLCSNYRTDNDELKVNNNNNEVTNNGESDSRRSESDDEIMFNGSMNEDELLKDLENMDIPIDNRRRPSDVIVIDDDEDIYLDKTTKNKEVNVKENKRNKNHEITVSDSIEPVIENARKSNKAKMPKEVSNRELSKEKSSDSFSSKSSVVFVQDADTVSDTNVRFLEDHIDSDEGISDSKAKMAGTLNENTNKTIKNESKEAVKETADDKLIVYQIVEEVNEDAIVKPDSELKRIVEAKSETYKENMSKEKVSLDEKESVKAKVNYKETKKDNLDEDMSCIVATKTSDYKKIKIEKSNDSKNLVEAKLSDCYRKCKRVYQKRSKRDEKSDINKNDLIQNAEEIDNFPTMFCDPCKPSFKRVSEDENVKYCLNCSSIFDTNDCTYCTKKFKNKILICVPCKIKFCCDNFYKTHEKHGRSCNTILK